MYSTEPNGNFFEISNTKKKVKWTIPNSLFKKKNLNFDIQNVSQVKVNNFKLLSVLLTVIFFSRIVLSLCYDAISRNIEGLGLDPFLVFTITSASIFPSCLVILLLQDKIGRKVMAILFLLLTGLFNIMQGMTLVLWKDVAMIAAIVGLLGRFSVNVAYNSGTQYAAELIPTQVRGQGLAVMHAIGYGATFFSPHILYLVSSFKLFRMAFF